MAVHGMIGDRVVVALNGRDDLLSGEYAAIALDEEKQEPEFGFRQIQRLTFQKRIAAGRIQGQPGHLH